MAPVASTHRVDLAWLVARRRYPRRINVVQAEVPSVPAIGVVQQTSAIQHISSPPPPAQPSPGTAGRARFPPGSRHHRNTAVGLWSAGCSVRRSTGGVAGHRPIPPPSHPALPVGPARWPLPDRRQRTRARQGNSFSPAPVRRRYVQHHRCSPLHGWRSSSGHNPGSGWPRARCPPRSAAPVPASVSSQFHRAQGCRWR